MSIKKKITDGYYVNIETKKIKLLIADSSRTKLYEHWYNKNGLIKFWAVDVNLYRKIKIACQLKKK